jgi:hypothetical protein
VLDRSLIAPSDISVVVGSVTYPINADTSGCAESVLVTQIIPHPSFNKNNLNNDIGQCPSCIIFGLSSKALKCYFSALLILSKALNFAGSNCYCPLCVTDKLPVLGETCVISGFGSQSTLPDTCKLHFIINLI